MSLTVVPANNNSWQNQLFNFVSPLLSDWIKSAREAEQNRKQNAAIAKTIQDIQNLAQSQNQNISLSQPPMPDGYNSDGWQQAFHKNGSPLELFDLGTSGASQKSTSLPTMADMINAYAANLGTERFGMLNPKTAMELFSPILNANEAARIERRNSSLAEAIKNAKDYDELSRTLFSALPQAAYDKNGIDVNAINAAEQQYRYRHPYMENWSFNDGQNTHVGYRNPVTGEIVPTGNYPMHLTPQQVEDNSYRRDEANRNDARYYAGLESQERINNANLDERRHEHDSNLEYNRENRDWEHNNPTLTSFRGQDGTLYFANPRTGEIIEAKTPDGKTVKIEHTKGYAPRIGQDSNGNFIIIDPNTNTATPVIKDDGTQQQGQPRYSNTTRPNTRDMTDSQKTRYNDIVKKTTTLNREATKLREDIAKYRTQCSVFANNPNDPMYISAKENLDSSNARLAQIETKLAELEAEKQRILGDTSNPPQKNSTPVGMTPFPRPDEPVNTPTATSPDITVISPDLPVNTPDSSNTRPENVTQTPRKKGDKVTAELPDDIFFDPNRDSDIPETQIMTMAQFQNWFSERLGDPHLQNLTPEQILSIAVEKGIRIKRDNTQASLPVEVTGTTFMSEDLPGLQPHGELATSLTPMGLSRNQSTTSGRYSEGTPRDFPNYQEFAPPAVNPISNPPKVYPMPDDFQITPIPPYNPDDDDPYPMSSLSEPPIYYDRNGKKAPPDIQRKYLERDGYKFDENGKVISGSNARIELLTDRTNPRRNNTLKNSRNTSRRQPRANPPRTNYPKRTPRKPGQIIPNTSYDMLRNEVDSSARRHGVDSELVRAIIQIESGWDSNATGPLTRYGHARGLMQLIDATAREQGVRDSYNPAQNIEGGTKYIAYLIRRYKGNIAKALMAYNTGPGNVDKGSIPSVTRKYARDVIAIYNRLKSRRGR